ncbi:MAG: hypothetical protein IJB17_03905, partial [Oscillospiraceae bacterium]|nr:hypothetical protein [Oscillospiraceae bacterium]
NTMTAKVSYTDHYGRAKSYTIPGSEFFLLQGAGYVGVRVDTLVAADVYSVVSIEICDSGNNVVATAGSSVETMAVLNYKTYPLFVELMKFCVSAYDSFH